MKAQTQVNIGLITAGFLFIAGIYSLVFWQHSVQSIIKWFFSPHIVLCLIYIFALVRKKLRTAQVVYYIFWFTAGLIVLGLSSFVAIALVSKSGIALRGRLEGAILVLLWYWLPYGNIVLLLRMGLKGLEQVIQTEHPQTSKNNE